MTMEFNQLPCIYLPTQVVMVDDNISFLENIRLIIHDYKNVILFSNPIAAISSLLAYDSLFDGSDFMLNLDGDEIDEDNAFLVNYGRFPELINSTHEISVLIVDYSMPEMNGIDFLNQIKSLKAKKILLTGEADNQIAVNAFNQGLIDRFIVKGGDKVNETLCDYVTELKQQYFVDTQLNQLVLINSQVKVSPEYTKLANEWLKKYSIERFYQINHHGSLMGLDGNNKYHCFYLMSDACINEYTEIAQSQDASQSLQDELINKTAMPVFITEESMKEPVNRWVRLMNNIESGFEFNLEKYYYCNVSLT